MSMRANDHFWRYQAAGCKLIIAPKPNGQFDLFVNDEVVGVYSSAQAAADDVFTCTTGSDEWDRQGTVDQPTDIHEWQVVMRG